MKQAFGCFESNFPIQEVDRSAFTFGHKLLGDPTLTLESLANIIPRLPKDHVHYSAALLRNGDDFEGTFKAQPKHVSIEQTIERLGSGDGYIMVSQPEVDPAFKDLHRQMLADVEAVIAARGMRGGASSAKLFLFIAAPGGVTPFHMDRYSTFLLQFRGTKEVTVFPQWDEQSITAADCEAYTAYAKTKLPWSDAIDARGKKFVFSPGQALHIPFAAGHHVKNGAGDISISMSMIFNTVQSTAWRGALEFNHRSRKVWRKLGLKPVNVGRNPALDRMKAATWRGYARLRGQG
jgi:quercetin dioxygenase-like cupin family protein